MIGVVQVGSQRMADRYAYLPFIGLYICAVWMVSAGLQRVNRAWLTVTVPCCVFVFLSVCCFRQVGLWSDSEGLFSHALSTEPRRNFVAHHGLASAYAEGGRRVLALKHVRAALEIEPQHAGARGLAGILLRDTGRLAEAVPHLQFASEANPTNANLHLDLGNALRDSGDYDRAIEHFRTALEIGDISRRDVLLTNYGITLFLGGDLDAALPVLESAVQQNPQSVTGRNNLAAALVQVGRSADAVSHYEAILEAEPKNMSAFQGLVKAHLNAVEEFSKKTDFESAEHHCQQVENLLPKNPVAFNCQGKLVLQQGRADEAVVFFRKALQLNAEFPEATENLEAALNASATSNRLED